jgi:hypothetical protein
MRRIICTLVVGMALALAPAVPAHAATPTVWINVVGASAWPVGAAVTTVDHYTSSVARYGSCRTGARCVTILERTIRSDWAAVTRGAGTARVTIYLNPQRRYYSWYTRRSIVLHELGHAYGIYLHNSTCVSVMYGYVFCPGGALPPYRFTAYQRGVLWRH